MRYFDENNAFDFTRFRSLPVNMDDDLTERGTKYSNRESSCDSCASPEAAHQEEADNERGAAVETTEVSALSRNVSLDAAPISSSVTIIQRHEAYEMTDQTTDKVVDAASMSAAPKLHARDNLYTDHSNNNMANHRHVTVEGDESAAFETVSATVSFASTVHTRQTSSSGSSSISDETLFTDYGLHRALNGLTISQTHIHTASKKERKSIRYLDDLRTNHDRLRRDLDDAVAVYQNAFTLRDANDDPKMEGTLNSQFLLANNRLARLSREYNAFIDDLNEIRHVPKLSRAAMETKFTHRKMADKLDRQDEHDIAMRAKLRDTRERIQELERERTDLIIQTNAVANLTRHNANVEAQKAILEKDLAYSQEWAVDLDKHCKEANARAGLLNLELQTYKSQLSFAKSEATRYKDESKKFKRELLEMKLNCDAAAEEIQRLNNVNRNLGNDFEAAVREVHHLSDSRDAAIREVQGLSDSNERLCNSNEVLNDKLDAAVQELRRLGNSNERLSNSVERLSKNCNAEVEYRDSIIAGLRHNNEHLRSEFEEVHGQAVEYKRQVDGKALSV